MLFSRHPKQSIEGETAGGSPPAVEVPAAPEPVEPPSSKTDPADLRDKLREGSAKLRRELAAQNEQLAQQIEAEKTRNAELAKRLEALEVVQTNAAAEKRKAALTALLDAAKVKATARDYAAFKLGDIDPSAPDAASKVDAWAKANADHVEATSLTAAVRSPWLGNAPPPAAPRDPNARPTGRDFMPPDLIPN